MVPQINGTILVGYRYPELDGIRGIAILLVLFMHCRLIAMPDSGLESIYFLLADTGWIGVELFFVLSGFLITGILIDTAHREDYFSRFYKRRASRIFPLYYAVLGLFTIAFAELSLEPRAVLAGLSYWFYLQNWLSVSDLPQTEVFEHFWSLAVEGQFYVFWPWLVLFAVRKGCLENLCLTVLVLSFLIRAVLISAGYETYFLTVTRMDGLALGAYVAVLFQRDGNLLALRPYALRLAACSGAVILLIISTRGAFRGTDLVVLRFGLLPLAVFFASFLIIALTSSGQGKLRCFLRNPFLRFAGAISYGMYVIHFPIIVLLRPRWPLSAENFWLAQGSFTVTVATLSIAIAWFSFRFFEKPILQMSAPSKAAVPIPC